MATADTQQSLREFMLRNVKASLGAIKARSVPTGGSSGYFYTPDFVKRVSRFSKELLDSLEGDAGYFVTVGREEPQEAMTQKRFASTIEVFVLACVQFRANAEDPFRRDDDDRNEDTARNEILKDAIRGLSLDFNRGRVTLPAPVGSRSIATNTNFKGFRVDAGQFLPWVMVELALLVDYDFLSMEP